MRGAHDRIPTVGISRHVATKFEISTFAAILGVNTSRSLYNTRISRKKIDSHLLRPKRHYIRIKYITVLNKQNHANSFTNLVFAEIMLEFIEKKWNIVLLFITLLECWKFHSYLRRNAKNLKRFFPPSRHVGPDSGTPTVGPFFDCFGDFVEFCRGRNRCWVDLTIPLHGRQSKCQKISRFWNIGRMP